MNQLCKKCGKEKPLTEEFFKKTKLVSTGFYKTCKSCCAQYQPNYGRDKQMYHRYKLTTEQYEEKLESQGGVCELCGALPKVQKRRLAVDHDHRCCPGQRSCGKCLRGILCADCNRKIGFLEQTLRDALVFPMLGSSDSWTARALRYIAQYEAKKETQ